MEGLSTGILSYLLSLDWIHFLYGILIFTALFAGKVADLVGKIIRIFHPQNIPLYQEESVIIPNTNEAAINEIKALKTATKTELKKLNDRLTNLIKNELSSKIEEEVVAFNAIQRTELQVEINNSMRQVENKLSTAIINEISVTKDSIISDLENKIANHFSSESFLTGVNEAAANEIKDYFSTPEFKNNIEHTITREIGNFFASEAYKNNQASILKSSITEYLSQNPPPTHEASFRTYTTPLESPDRNNTQAPYIIHSQANVPIPMFNPNIDDATQFISEVETYMQQKRIPTGEWLTQLNTVFQKNDKQLLWWKRTKFVISTWDEFCSNFKQFYGTEGDRDKALSNLVLKTQKPNESFETFALETELQYLRLFPEKKSKPKDALEFISERALPHLKPHLLGANCANIYDLIKFGNKIDKPNHDVTKKNGDKSQGVAQSSHNKNGYETRKFGQDRENPQTKNFQNQTGRADQQTSAPNKFPNQNARYEPQSSGLGGKPQNDGKFSNVNNNSKPQNKNTQSQDIGVSHKSKMAQQDATPSNKPQGN